jgi:hypothetical protein
VKVYALTSSQVAGETLDLFLTREAAETGCGKSLRTSLDG